MSRRITLLICSKPPGLGCWQRSLAKLVSFVLCVMTMTLVGGASNSLTAVSAEVTSLVFVVVGPQFGLYERCHGLLQWLWLQHYCH